MHVAIRRRRTERERRRVILSGEVPSPDRRYPGCPFADRCSMAEVQCLEAMPGLDGDDDHRIACFYAWDEERYQASLIEVGDLPEE